MRGLVVAVALAVSSASLADSPRLVSAAREQARGAVVYDGSYTRIAYPMGDVPANRGVCTDLVIRAYRAIGVDLQVLVHEDMRAHFELYPDRWGLSEPDASIDHRRVPNLQRFLERAGAAIDGTGPAGATAARVTAAGVSIAGATVGGVGTARTAGAAAGSAAAYLPGDLVTWLLPGNLPHIGIVSDRLAPGTSRPLMIHNIGAGPAEEDMLLAYPITGHYRYRVQ